MKIRILFWFALLAFMNLAKAQTLFTYGTHAVSKDEFLQAYNKNPDTTGNSDEKLKQYLDLYINFRLKLQAAYDEKADKNADIIAETDNFKTQLTDNFINRQADINQLIHEAFLRSQKDILVQQVFVKFPSADDTTDAYTQISKAYDELKAGKNFESISVTYSNDSAVKLVKGNIGYITVFTLPYPIENIIYNLKPEEFSAIYKSTVGYHIFKNAGEKPALGRRKIQQLIFPTPSFYTDGQINAAAHTADSIYNILQKGTSFDSLLPLYGQNYEAQDTNSIEVNVGDYSEDFEKEVFSLKNVGDISRPFKTAYGYNIVKLTENLPVSNDENNISSISWLQKQIQNDSRLNSAKNNLTEKWLGITGFKETSYKPVDLWAYTDSALNNTGNLLISYKTFKLETVLFQFTKKKVTVKDWIDYLNNTGLPESNNGQHDYAKQMHDFIRVTCNNYYRQHIEDFNPDMAEQLKEFNDANLIFYEMDKHVWSKASNDSSGLKKYYETHKANYQWKESVSAIIISAPQKIIADSISADIKKNPAAWRTIVTSYNTVYADSNRFEINELPVKQQVLLQKDFQTAPEANDSGDSYTFIHVIQVYSQPGQKSFEEAKGMVINDYQHELERVWLNELKERYPLKIDKVVLNTLH